MKKNFLIVVAAILVFVGAFLLRDSTKESPVAANIAGQSTALPRLVDLGSDKCVPCKKMAPILDNLAKDYRGSLLVEIIDIMKNPAAGEPWEIRVIPTQIFLDAAGKELFRHEGFLAEEAILAKWRELGFDLTPVRAAAGK